MTEMSGCLIWILIYLGLGLVAAVVGAYTDRSESRRRRARDPEGWLRRLWRSPWLRFLVRMLFWPAAAALVFMIEGC